MLLVADVCLALSSYDSSDELKFLLDPEDLLQLNLHLVLNGQVHGSLDNQNSDEEGVFISDIARKLSSIDGVGALEFGAAEIRAFSFRMYRDTSPVPPVIVEKENGDVGNPLQPPIVVTGASLPPSTPSPDAPLPESNRWFGGRALLLLVPGLLLAVYWARSRNLRGRDWRKEA